MKKLNTILVLVAAIMVLAGCSSKSATIDTKQLSDELLNGVAFQDELTLADENIVKMLYNVEDYVNAYVYIGSGATAEEIAVFELADADSAKQVLENVKTRIADQKEDFSTYVPEEVKRLDNAVVKQSGNYVIMCVSNGDEAENIISQYVK